MRTPQFRHQRGFSNLELAVVITLISILFVFIANRLLELIDQAEQVRVQTVIAELQSALAIELVEHVVKGRMAEVNSLPGSNPMKLLPNPPKNYHGPVNSKQLQQAESGNWYYNTDTQLLVYLLQNAEQFSSELPGRPRIRLRIVPVYDDLNKNGQFEPHLDRIKGVSLRFKEKFTWKGLKIYINSHSN